MSDNGRLSLLFLCHVLLYLAIGEVNTFISQWGLYLHLDALLLLFFGLYLSQLRGLLYAAVLGFLVESMSPVPHGLALAGYLGIWLFFVACQRRIRRQNPFHVRTVTIAVQLLWLLVLSLLMGSHWLGEPAYLKRVLTDMLVSSLALYLLAWPWCQFQKKLLYSLGWDLEAQISRL